MGTEQRLRREGGRWQGISPPQKLHPLEGDPRFLVSCAFLNLPSSSPGARFPGRPGSLRLLSPKPLRLRALGVPPHSSRGLIRWRRQNDCGESVCCSGARGVGRIPQEPNSGSSRIKDRTNDGVRMSFRVNPRPSGGPVNCGVRQEWH